MIINNKINISTIILMKIAVLYCKRQSSVIKYSCDTT